MSTFQGVKTTFGYLVLSASDLSHRQTIWSSDVSLLRFQETPAFPWDAAYSEKGASAWSPDLWPPGFAWGGWMEGNLGFLCPVRISQAFLSARESGSAADTSLTLSVPLTVHVSLSVPVCWISQENRMSAHLSLSVYNFWLLNMIPCRDLSV